MSVFKAKTISGIAIASLGFSVFSMAYATNWSAVTNNTNNTLTITSEAGNTGKSITVAPGCSAMIPLDTWGQSNLQQYWFNISGATCPAGTFGRYNTKHDPNTVAIIDDGSCSVGTTQPDTSSCQGPIIPGPGPGPISPPGELEPIDPVISGLTEDVYLQVGDQYTARGYVDNADAAQGASITVEILNSNSLKLFVTQHQVSNDRVQINASSNVFQDTDAGQIYSYVVSGTSLLQNGDSGLTQYAVNVHVSPKDTADMIIPRTISAWVYDGSGGNTSPGAFITYLRAYNTQPALPENYVSELHTYGSDMEIWGKGKILQMYYITNTHDLNKGRGVSRTDGPENVLVYKNDVPNVRFMTPIIDGRTDVGYLKEFNDLTKKEAEAYADLVAQQVCLDPHIEGTQIDLEPLNFVIQSTRENINAQVEFYNRLIENFAGDHLRVCQGKNKFVSVFTFASKIRAGLDGPYGNRVAKLLESPHFLVIDSLYDLTPTLLTEAPQNGAYDRAVKSEVAALMEIYKDHPFNFKFGVPASCSFHECSSTTQDGRPNNIAFVQRALEAMKTSNVCSAGDHFKGIALWAMDNETVTWEGQQYTIVPPTTDTQAFIGGSASQTVGCSLNSGVPMSTQQSN